MTEPNEAVGNIGWIYQYIGCGNADDLNAQRGKVSVSPRVARRLITHVMRYAVNLDHKLAVGAVEIDDYLANRMLPTKLHAVGPFAKDLPQQNFGQRHFASQPLD